MGLLVPIVGLVSLVGVAIIVAVGAAFSRAAKPATAGLWSSVGAGGVG